MAKTNSSLALTHCARPPELRKTLPYRSAALSFATA